MTTEFQNRFSDQQNIEIQVLEKAGRSDLVKQAIDLIERWEQTTIDMLRLARDVSRDVQSIEDAISENYSVGGGISLVQRATELALLAEQRKMIENEAVRFAYAARQQGIVVSPADMLVRKEA